MAHEPLTGPKLVVIGSSNTDLVIRCVRLPKPGETLLGGEFVRFAGGKGANQAVAAARAGAAVTFLGAHGDDEFGRAAKATLHAEGINTRLFRKKSGVPSGVALILVGGRTRENVIAVARSANDELQPEDVKAGRAAIARADAVVCQLEVPLSAVEMAVRIAAEFEKPLILNPAPARRLSTRLLRHVAVLTPNEREAEILTGCKSPAKAARELRSRGCRAIVITLGARGALVSDEAGERRIPAARVKPVDTVGAGDCFTAWLAVSIARGQSLDRAAQRAAAAASIAITRLGAQAGMPYANEVPDLPM